MSSDLVTGGSLSAESTVKAQWELPPASIPAWVTVWLQVYVQVSVTSSLLLLFASPVGAAGAVSHFGSLNVISVRVTLPVFFTLTLSLHDALPILIDVVVEVLSTLIDLV